MSETIVPSTGSSDKRSFILFIALVAVAVYCCLTVQLTIHSVSIFNCKILCISLYMLLCGVLPSVCHTPAFCWNGWI